MDLVKGEDLGSFEAVHRTGRVMGPGRYERCRWEGVEVVGTKGVSIEDRSWVVDVEFVRCRADADWRFSRTVLDGVVWERPRGQVWLKSCALRHVRVVGPVSWLWYDQMTRDDLDEAVVAQNAEFHTTVDWMLDVSEADIRDGRMDAAVPAKVVIDPERQAFVRAGDLREAAELVPSKEELRGVVAYQLRSLLGATEDDDREFLNVFSKSKVAAAERELIARLHEAGVTMPTYTGTT